MKINTLIATILLIILTGCTMAHPPGSVRALDAATHRKLMNECMAYQVENTMEMASIDPSFNYRRCRQYANSRVRHP